MKKRIIFALLLSAISLFSFGCSFKEDSDIIKITFATSVYVEDPHRIAIDELIKEYNKKNPNVQVEVYGVGWSDFWNNMTVEIVAGNEADILQVYPYNIAAMDVLRPEGVFEDLSQYMGGTNYTDLLTGQDMCIFDGTPLALSSYAWGNTAIFYRKSLLEKINVNPNAINTWNDFIEVSKKLKDNGITSMGIVDSSHSFVVSEWARMIARPVSSGIYFKNESAPYTSENIQVNSEANIWAAKEWQKFLLQDQYGKSAPDKKDSREYFWNGLAAFCYDGPWFVGMTEQRDKELFNDVGIIPAFSVEYKGRVHKPNPQMYPLVCAISKNSKHKKEAWDFINWMSSVEAQKIVAKCGMIPSNIEYSSSDEYKNQYQMSSLFVDFLEKYAPQIADPSIPQQGELENVMINATQEIFSSGQDAAEVLNRAADECKEIMSR